MIKKIELTNFRGFKNLEINTDNRLVIITGNNAVGKTSVLESIYYVATSKSHRTNELDSLIKDDSEFVKINIIANKKYTSIISKEGKTNSINGVVIKKISDYIGSLKAVMFSPLDLELINGSKNIRRNFLDLQISILDKVYLYHLNNYKHLLKERNILLKENNSDLKMLNILTKSLAIETKNIYLKRIDFINQVNDLLKETKKSLKMKEDVVLKYNPSYDSNDIEKSFLNKINYDILTKTTNSGTHRDDFSIYIDNHEANIYASQGQRRQIVIALKICLKELIYKYTKEEPVLLLDDVFNELDQIRQNDLIDFLKDSNQTIITTTNLLNVPDSILKDSIIIHLNLSKKE